MNKPLIGIIMRPDKSIENHDILLEYTSISKIIKELGGIVIGIPLTNSLIDNYRLIDKCDGIIGQGGDDFTSTDQKLVRYIYKHNIPFLGICLSMQLMGYIFNGNLKNLDNLLHKSKEKYVHKVKIIKNSLLHLILKKDEITVNSRHKSYVAATNLKINAISEDGIIEGLEDKNHKFFLGLQWHPEDMFEYDIESKLIFDYFIKICRGE